MVREWKPMHISKRARNLRSATNRIFLQKYSLKLQMLSKQTEEQTESSYHVNQLTCLTSISIRRGRFRRLGRDVHTRIGSRTRRRRPRRAVASVIDAVTINLHARTMKFGLIGTIPMTGCSEISSRMLLIRTGTVLARLANFCDFPSKPAKNQGKWRKTRGTSQCNFL